MINKPIWIVSCKARPLEGCSIKFDNSEFYFVESLVPANSSSKAQAPLSAALSEARFELEEVISSKPYVAREWRDELQFPEIEDAAQKSAQTGNLVFALFISQDPIDSGELEHSSYCQKI